MNELNQALARVIHEANRAWNVHLNDHVPDAPWDALSPVERQMVTERVAQIRDGAGPAQIHQSWIEFMTAQGWKLGAVKDPGARPPTHPCLRPYADLPHEQQAKDDMAVAIITALTGPVATDPGISLPGGPWIEAAVCTTHMCFVPCRKGPEGCSFSSDTPDVARVREYQQSGS